VGGRGGESGGGGKGGRGKGRDARGRHSVSGVIGEKHESNRGPQAR